MHMIWLLQKPFCKRWPSRDKRRDLLLMGPMVACLPLVAGSLSSYELVLFSAYYGWRFGVFASL